MAFNITSFDNPCRRRTWEPTCGCVVWDEGRLQEGCSPRGIREGHGPSTSLLFAVLYLILNFTQKRQSPAMKHLWMSQTKQLRAFYVEKHTECTFLVELSFREPYCELKVIRLFIHVTVSWIKKKFFIIQSAVSVVFFFFLVIHLGYSASGSRLPRRRKGHPHFPHPCCWKHLCSSMKSSLTVSGVYSGFSIRLVSDTEAGEANRDPAHGWGRQTFWWSTT